MMSTVMDGDVTAQEDPISLDNFEQLVGILGSDPHDTKTNFGSWPARQENPRGGLER